MHDAHLTFSLSGPAHLDHRQTSKPRPTTVHLYPPTIAWRETVSKGDLIWSFLKECQLRYTVVKKSRIELIKNLKKNIFLAGKQPAKNPDVRGCVIFCLLTYVYMNQFCHSCYSKCSKNYKINGIGFISISLKLTEKLKTA